MRTACTHICTHYFRLDKKSCTGFQQNQLKQTEPSVTFSEAKLHARFKKAIPPLQNKIDRKESPGNPQISSPLLCPDQHKEA